MLCHAEIYSRSNAIRSARDGKEAHPRDRTDEGRRTGAEPSRCPIIRGQSFMNVAEPGLAFLRLTAKIAFATRVGRCCLSIGDRGSSPDGLIHGSFFGVSLVADIPRPRSASDSAAKIESAVPTAIKVRKVSGREHICGSFASHGRCSS